MKDSDWEKLIEGAGIIGQSKLIIDDTPGISISELRSKCRKYKLEHGLDIIIIDYLQLMTGSVEEVRVQTAGSLRHFPTVKGTCQRAECAGSIPVTVKSCGRKPSG